MPPAACSWIGAAPALPRGAARPWPALARHDLVWLDPVEAPARLLAAREPDRELAAAWVRAGRPFVVRREDAASALASARWLALGLPLPSRLDRRRLALRAPRAVVLRTGRMPLLADACEAAFSGWRRSLRQLCAQLSGSGAAVRAYGSLGWQHLTGEPYLHPASDIDLLIEPGPGADIERLLAILSDAGADDCPRLDGEITLAPDRRVAWRELFTDTPEVLVRGLDELSLVSRETVHRLLEPGVAAC